MYCIIPFFILIFAIEGTQSNTERNEHREH